MVFAVVNIKRFFYRQITKPKAHSVDSTSLHFVLITRFPVTSQRTQISNSVFLEGSFSFRFKNKDSHSVKSTGLVGKTNFIDVTTYLWCKKEILRNDVPWLHSLGVSVFCSVLVLGTLSLFTFQSKVELPKTTFDLMNSKTKLLLYPYLPS